MPCSLSCLRTISPDEKDSLSIHSIGCSMGLPVHGTGAPFAGGTCARVQYLCFAAPI